MPWPTGARRRAICSTPIAQLFLSVRYPILPLNKIVDRDSPNCPACAVEIPQVRHHCVLVPCDLGDFAL